MICGTGSNGCLLQSTPSGSLDTEFCGGWGHMLGDEASGSLIALQSTYEYNLSVREYSFVRCAQATGLLIGQSRR